MYMKVIFFSSLLIIHDALSYKHEYNSWSKIETQQWFDSILLENQLFLNDSTFDNTDLVPQYSFFLRVQKSSIPNIPPNALRNLTAMTGAILSDVGIKTVSPGAFNGSDQLAEIDLSKNKLIQVDDGVFNKISTLKYLDLSYNNITSLSEGSFKGLQKLSYLYLQGNKISLLPNNLFESQVKTMLKLDLSSNRFQDISLAIRKLSHLTGLFLQMNNISDVGSDSLKYLTSLQYLDLSSQYNKISFLDSNVFNSQKKFLITLNISSNGLKEINTAFHGMGHLTHLNLQENKISSLASDSFQDLSSLQHLDLSNNSIQDLYETIFSGCKMITNLYLQNNKITFLDSNLFKSQRHSLMILNLSSNALTGIGTAFLGMGHLTHLYLQKNRISSSAANSFQDLSSLEYLDISHNNLERFQYGLLDHLDHLMYLNFSNNKFEKFPFEFLSYLTNLKELVFENNKIKSLNQTEIILNFPSLEKIGLSGNFNFSCLKLVKFVKELRTKKIEVLKGNYFGGDNVRGMACCVDDFDTGDKDSNEMYDNEINSKNIRELINVVLEKHNGNNFVTTLITISTLALIVMTFLQSFFVVKLRRNTHKDNLELI